MSFTCTSTYSDEERAKDLRALRKMAAHMETLLDDVGLDDSTPGFCLETFRALLTKEIETLEGTPGSRPSLRVLAGTNNIN